MSSSQNIQVKPEASLDAHIKAGARSKVDTTQIIDMDIKTDKLNTAQKKHTNTNSRIVSIIGCVIIGFIIYNLVVNHTNF